MTALRRLIPQGLIGQLALVMALVLLVAQGINFRLVLSERQRSSMAEIEGQAIDRVVSNIARLAAAGRLEDGPVELRRGRGAVSDSPALPPDASDERLVTQLRNSATASNMTVRDARAQVTDTLPEPLANRAEAISEKNGGAGRARFQALHLSIQMEDGRWLNAQLLVPRPDPWLVVRLLGGTLLVYIALLAALIFVIARMTRPLRDLTDAARRFGGVGAAPLVEPRGPADIRRAIDAFNAMSTRVSSLIEEKDRMLGAIGHDLRTPLASLRIRAEGVEPAEEGDKMIATIEEMAAMLDDTLALARSGRSSEPLRALDVGALVDTVVEELKTLGSPVEMKSDRRVVATIRPHLVQRAVRNLAENAVKYAGSAEVSVREAADRVEIEIADRGPGIPEPELARVQEPFVRLEASRNRETGGSGLGLTLARAAALIHGGALELENREGGGLIARLVLPKGS